MNKIVKSELYKLFHNKIVFFSFLVILVFSIGIYHFSSLFHVDSIVSVVSSTISTVDILFIVVVASLIGTDYEAKTMKNIILSGVSKTKIYLGRLIACIITCTIILLVGVLASGISAGLLYGFNITNSEIMLLLESVGLQFVMLLGIVSLTYFISSIIKRTNYALMLSILIMNCSSMLFSYLDDKFNLNLIGYDYASLMNSIATLSINGQVLTHLAITVGSLVVVTIIIGTGIFRKSEV